MKNFTIQKFQLFFSQNLHCLALSRGTKVGSSAPTGIAIGELSSSIIFFKHLLLLFLVLHLLLLQQLEPKWEVNFYKIESSLIVFFIYY